MKAVDGTVKTSLRPRSNRSKTKTEEKKTEEKGSVSGKVTYKGKPLTGGVVILTDADGKVKADLGDDGTYKLNVKPGQYKVAVDAKDVPEKFHSPKRRR